MRRLLAMTIHRVPSALAIPDIPFIERQPKLLRRALLTAHQIANGQRLSDLPIHGKVHRDKLLAAPSRFSRRVFEVAMQRKSVDVVVAPFQYFAIPVEICGHAWSAGSASNQ